MVDNTIGPLGTIGAGQGPNSLMNQQQMQAIIQSLQQKNNPNNATQAAVGSPQPMASPIGAAANSVANGVDPIIQALLKQKIAGVGAPGAVGAAPPVDPSSFAFG